MYICIYIYVYMHIYIYIYIYGGCSPGGGPLGAERTRCRNSFLVLLPSEEGTTFKVLRTFTWKPRPESGRDCLTCAIFAVERKGNNLKGFNNVYLEATARIWP